MTTLEVVFLLFGIRSAVEGTTPPAEPIERIESVAPVVDTESSVDALVSRQLDMLRRFGEGESVPDVEAIFEVDLEDEAAVRRRVAVLETRQTGVEGLEAELDAQRLSFLRTWSETLSAMSQTSKLALRELGDGKRDLRAAGRKLESLEPGLVALANAIQRKIESARTGGMLGFRSRLSDWAESAEVTRMALRRTATESRLLNAKLQRAGGALELHEAQFRSRFFGAALRDNKSELDELFLDTIERQRALSLSLDRPSLSSVAKSVAHLATTLRAETQRIDQVSDYESAVASLDHTDTVLTEVRQTLEQCDALPQVFEEASLREALTVVLPLASADARSEAYPLGTELIGELKSELRTLWIVAARYLERRIEKFSSGAGLRDAIPRLLLTLVLLALAGGLHRRSPRIVSALVRRLAKTSVFRRRVGALVRWAGLLQAIAPVAVVAVIAYPIYFVLGSDRIESRFLEILFRWGMLYWLGRAAMLGAARRVSAGRPALIDASDETLVRLQRSYNQIGGVLTFGAAVEELARTLLALGRLRATIEVLVLLWATVWVLYACFSWRKATAERILQRTPADSRWQHIGEWMRRSRFGALLVVPALVRLFGGWLWQGVSVVLLSQGVFAYFKARELRRQATAAREEPKARPLPQEYAAEFPLYPVLGEVDSILIQRGREIEPIVNQFSQWRESGRESSLALVGEKGGGKTTLLATLRNRISSLPVGFCTLRERLLTAEDVTRALGPVVEAAEGLTLDALIAHLNEADERVVIVDDAHLSFLRIVDGYRGFDALVHVVNHTGTKVFWVLAFNDYAWGFLNAAHGGRAYFRRVQRITRWSSDELRDLLGRRTKKAGYELEFDEQLTDDERVDTSDIRLIEGADGFFRLLWEASRGNPRAATSLWLRSLALVGEKRLRVQLFSSAKSEVLSRASDDLYFALAAITQHENLDAEELCATLNVDPSFTSFALQFLTESGIIGPKLEADSRYTIRVRHYWDVVQALRDRNLLYQEGS